MQSLYCWLTCATYIQMTNFIITNNNRKMPQFNVERIPIVTFFSLYCILKYFTKILIVLDLICPERWTEASLMIYYFCIETLLGSSEPAPEITIVNITYDLGPHTFISDTCYLTFCKQPLKVGKQSKRAWKSHRSMLDSRGEKLDVVWMSA